MRVVIFMLALLVSSASYAQDTVNEGVQAYQNKSYQKAFKYFKTAAESGNPQGQNDLGVFYMNSIPHTDEKYKKINMLVRKSSKTKCQTSLL